MTGLEILAELTGFPRFAHLADCDYDSIGSILLTVLGVFNLIFSIIGATAIFKSRSAKQYDALLGCLVTTGFINALATYLRRNSVVVDDSWFGCAFTMTLVLDSVLNVTTAVRIMRAYRGEVEVEEEMVLPLYGPEKLPPLLEVSGEGVWLNEKTIIFCYPERQRAGTVTKSSPSYRRKRREQ